MAKPKFKFIQSDTIVRDFEIVAPDDSVIVVKGCEFKFMEMQAYLDMANEIGDSVLSEIVLSWDSFVDSQGNVLEFSEESLGLIAEQHFVKVNIFEVYVAAINGADRKNSSASQLRGRKTRKARPIKVSGKRRRH